MKKLFITLPLALILCFMVGCQDKAAMAELEGFRAQAAVEEKNKEIAKGLFEELNKGNLEIWKELCAPEFAYYYPSEIPEPMSLEQTYEHFQMAFKSFPDFNMKTLELIAKGDKVITRQTVTGTHEEEYHGIPATGIKIKFSVILILQFKDGKCIEIRDEGDYLGMMMQLGFELKPKEGEK
jgi:predicted ester cyclase